jgi:hypothetical protein
MSVPYSQVHGVQKTPPLPREFSVEITRTTPLFPRKVYIQWTLRKPPASAGFRFDVYSAGASEGPWDLLHIDLPDTFYCVDSTANLFSLHRVIYYKVVCRYGAVEVSAVRKLEAGLDRRREGIRRKLLRDSAKALKLVVGTEVAILKVRYWGEVCPHCVSKGTGQNVRAHCTYCWGIGILEGYWTPIYGYAQRQRSPIMTQVTPSGHTDVNKVSVIMLSVPQVEPGDLLVFLRDNKRYVVEVVSPTQIHSVDIHQELQVSELARSSREYGVPVDPWHDPGWF